MGDDQLNYLGFSYGTAIGQQLVELFPERVRAMIIDGVVELGPTGIESAVSQAAGFETALRSFADDCNADESCPIGPDAVGAIEELQARRRSRRRSLPTPTSAPASCHGPDAAALQRAPGPTWPTPWPRPWRRRTGMVELADEYLSIADFDVYYAELPRLGVARGSAGAARRCRRRASSRPTSARRSSTTT